MDNFSEGYFYNPTKGNLSVDEMIGEIISWMMDRTDKFYDIIIGCDSPAIKEPHFPVVVVVLRVGEGGRFFVKKVKYQGRKFYNLHQRVLEEVLLSCELASSLRENFAKKIILQASDLNYQFRYIHADVGENGPTREMIKEVVGLIRGNGFEPKIKIEDGLKKTIEWQRKIQNL